MPARGLERLTDLPIALLVRAAGALLSRAGPRAGYRFARAVGDGWYRLFVRRRRVALRNLEIAFPGALEAGERERIARLSCRHAIATAVDVFLRDRAISPSDWRTSITLDDSAAGLFGRPHPRGLAMLSAHLGDWELLHYAFALLGLPARSVARRIHNPHLDRLAVELRARHGASTVPKEGALRALRRTLAAEGTVGLMADQSAPAGERCFRFLGASGATYSRYARLLVRLEPEVAFAACVREGFAFRFRIIARDLTPALRGPGSEEERAGRLVEAYLRAVEEAVRAHPEQYLWVHRRWKHRPPGSPDLYQRLDRPLDPALLADGRLILGKLTPR